MTMKYKLVKFNDSYSIQRISDNISFLPNSKNAVYQQFVDDIYEQGIGIVEGANIQTQVSYVGARVAEYPPIEDQLDKIYHSGINAWKADIKKIKDKYPKTQVGITTTESLPSWIDTVLFDKQKEEYVAAKERLAQPELANGKKAVIGTKNVWSDKLEAYIDEDVIGFIIEPLPIVVKDENGNNIRNPLVVQDEAERVAAQEVINKTPQAVIDSINT